MAPDPQRDTGESRKVDASAATKVLPSDLLDKQYCSTFHSFDGVMGERTGYIDLNSILSGPIYYPHFHVLMLGSFCSLSDRCHFKHSAFNQHTHSLYGHADRACRCLSTNLGKKSME